MSETEKVLTFEDLSTKGWPHSRVYTATLVREGKFPKPFKAHDGGRRNLWRESDIDQFFAGRARPKRK